MLNQSREGAAEGNTGGSGRWGAEVSRGEGNVSCTFACLLLHSYWKCLPAGQVSSVYSSYTCKFGIHYAFLIHKLNKQKVFIFIQLLNVLNWTSNSPENKYNPYILQKTYSQIQIFKLSIDRRKKTFDEAREKSGVMQLFNNLFRQPSVTTADATYSVTRPNGCYAKLVPFHVWRYV